MLSFALAPIIIALSGLNEEVAARLAEPILSPDQTRVELEAFVLSRIPELTPPSSAETWRQEADRIRKDVLEKSILRGVPESWTDGPVGIEWLETIEKSDLYSIRKLRYEAVPGMWIPALLYVPANLQAPAPSVLNVNGHVGEPGKAVDYKQIRCINLAKRGVLALNPEWFRMGELESTVYGHDRIAYLDMAGVSGVSLFYLAMKRGLDVLEAQPNADPSRMAVTGLSGGGWQTIVISSLDTRVDLAVPNAGYIGTPTRIRFTSDIGDLEQVPAGLLREADYTHLTALLAPRPALLLYNAQDECCFQAYRAKPSVYDPIVPFYAALDAADRFAYHENADPGTHNYLLDNRQQLYAFLNRHFNLNTPDEELPSDGEVLTRADLDCGVPEGNETIISLAAKIAAPLPHAPAPAPDSPEFASWTETTRTKLRQVLRAPESAPDAKPALMSVQTKEGVEFGSYKLRIGEWTVPASSVRKEGLPVEHITVLLADEGRATMAERVGQVLNEGGMVLAFDPVFIGEAAFHEKNNEQFAMFVGSVDERLLGLEAAQIASVCQWARFAFRPKTIALEAKGYTCVTAAWASRSVYPDVSDSIAVVDAPLSFKDLIQEDAGYSRCIPVYCFGLLEVVDAADLRALAG
ncbi:MAG: hypothetical protein AMXMBFR84_04160 [Candidatus Hydrogenedentota bacterium]